ncbi:hypothetical protein V1294_006316 [Bradyrhizobium sp. AZCC 1678]|uniref:DUF5681 domain-containing protein n=1 Tax=Bradyrhizobium sp. AZCC 1678 TaxID=3117030 RepID=UPI002FF047CA
MSDDEDESKARPPRERLPPRKSARAKQSLKRIRLRSDDGRDDEVGYGKPPRSHQFKSGQSGNPKGRPKGSKNESTILKEVLNEKLSLRQSNGRIRKIPVLEGIHRKQTELALKGEVKSAVFVLNRYAALVSGELQPEDLSEDDRAVLDAFARRLRGSNNDDQ